MNPRHRAQHGLLALALSTAIQRIPPAPEPPKITARARAQNLHEHLQGFLAANNVQGWAESNAETAKSPVFQALIQLVQSPNPSMPLWRFKRHVKRIYKLGDKACQLAQMYNACARACGYEHYQHLLRACPDQVVTVIRHLDPDVQAAGSSI